jgi:hypothetical protein
MAVEYRACAGCAQTTEALEWRKGIEETND